MKKVKRAAAAFMSAMLVMSHVGAEGLFIEMKGKTSSDAIGATVMLLKENTDFNNIRKEDIAYINQSDISDDGTFTLELPLMLNYEKLTFRTNMTDFELSNEAAVRRKTVYVSQNGSDKNNGESEQTPLKTLEAACKMAASVKKIVLMSDYNYTNFKTQFSGVLEIEGINPNIVLTFPTTTYLYGNMKFDNLTAAGASEIFANGNSLEIGEKVTSNARLSVYGGKNGSEYIGDTSLTILGGKYNRIYGGGKNAAVNGNTNVVVGGNVNIGDGNNDQDSTTISPCNIYGGGYNGAVNGITNIVLKGNAVAKYVSGAGAGASGVVLGTNIRIEGGKYMNIFGGALDKNTELTCDTHITMTGGLAEAVFGGSQSASITGNTYVTLLGGDVSRRVYTGCYNNWSLGWSTKTHVTGTTTLAMGPDMKLNTKTGLASGNASNVGVFAGSRYNKSGFSDEINTVIFLDDCYSVKKDVLGDKSGWSSTFGSIAHYTVDASKGGSVCGTNRAGYVEIKPQSGMYAKIGDKTCQEGEFAIDRGVTKVEFVKNFGVNSLTASENGDVVTADVGVTAANVNNEPNPRVIVAVYELNNNISEKMIAVNYSLVTAASNTKSIPLNADLEAGKKYMVKAMIWNENEKPLTESYIITMNGGK